MNNCVNFGADCNMKLHNECCCTCEYQRAALAHPVNRGFAKGRIHEIIGWLCVMPDFDQPDAEGIRSAVFFESPHGLCEMYRPRITASH